MDFLAGLAKSVKNAATNLARVTYTEASSGRSFRVRKVLSDAGRFGQVYLAEEEGTERLYAMKVMPLTRENKNMVTHEAAVMKTLGRHPNIVHLEAFFSLPVANGKNEAVFVMENCDGGSLLDIMNSRSMRPFAEKQILGIFLEICKAVGVMHAAKPPIAHRDIKIENVLTTARGNWKLCDFGSATTKVSQPTNERERLTVSEDIENNTTAAYRAPEMIDLFRKQLISEKVDIWALGCFLYKFAFFEDAFPEGSLQTLNGRYIIPKYHQFSKEFLDLFPFIFVQDPEKRPHIGQVAGRVAALLGKANPLANFAPYNHATGTSEAKSVALGAHRPAPAPPTQSQTSFFDMFDAPAAPAPAKPAMATSSSQTDFFADFESNSPAPAAAPAKPVMTTSSSQTDFFADFENTSPATVTAPTQSSDALDFFGNPVSPSQSPAPAKATSPQPVFDDFFAQQPATVTKSASSTSFFDNDDFFPATPSKPSTSQSPAPAVDFFGNPVTPTTGSSNAQAPPSTPVDIFASAEPTVGRSSSSADFFSMNAPAAPSGQITSSQSSTDLLFSTTGSQSSLDAAIAQMSVLQPTSSSAPMQPTKPAGGPAAAKNYAAFNQLNYGNRW